MYQYPYGNAQQLNLDWILSKLQELETGSGGGADLEEVANALVSASFDAGVSYRRYDYCFYNGKLYRALNDTTGAFNPADWLEVVIGDDIPVLTRLLNAVDASVTSLQTTVGNQGNAITSLQNNAVTNVKYDAGYLKKTINGTDTSIIQIQDTPTEDSAKLPSSKAVYNVNAAISAEATARENADTTLQGQITAYIQTSLTASRSYKNGEYFVYNNTLYRAKRDISSGATITIGTNAVATTVGKDLYGGAIGYTPSFVWSNSATNPTVDNVGFSYAMLTPNLMFLFGRFRLVTKNVTAAQNMLCMTLPTEYITDTSRTNTFGIVQGDVFENFAIRPDNTRIFFAYGGAGNYSLSHFTEGTYYGVFCIIPVKLA